MQWLALLPHSKRVLGLNPPADWDPSVWSLHVLLVPAGVFSGYSGFLPQSTDMQVRLICDSKLPVGVSVSGCLSLYVGPMPAGIGSSTPTTHLTISNIENGWMDYTT